MEQENKRKHLESRIAAATVIQAFWRMHTASQAAEERRKDSLIRLALLEQVKELKLQLSKQEHVNTATRMDLKAKVIEIEELTAELSAKKLEIEVLRSSIAARDAHSTRKDETSKKLLEMEEANRITINSLKTEMKLLKENSENRTKDLEDLVVEKEDMMSALRKQLVDTRNSLAQAESENKDLSANFDHLHLQLRELKEKRNGYSMDEMESTIRDRVAPVQKQLESSIAEVAAQDAKIKDLTIKESLMVARIQSMSSRIEINEKEKMEMSRRQSALIEEINSLRQTQKGTPVPQTHQTLMGIQDLVPPKCFADDTVQEKQGHLKDPKKIEAVNLLINHCVRQRVDDVPVRCSSPSKQLLIPYSGWLSEHCLLGWSKAWSGDDVISSAKEVITKAVSEAEKSFQSSIYWLRATLLCGGLLKTQAVGTPNQKLLFGVANAFIGCSDLHTAIGVFISKQIPVDIHLLLSEEARQSARKMQNKSSATWESKLEVMSKSKDHWKKIIGSLENITLLLLDNLAPVPAVRAFLWASVRYIDGKLLNELLLRRAYCSVSSAKALKTGTNAIKAYILSQMDEHGDPILNTGYLAAAFSRTEQACQFLTDGYHDCVRRARSGIDIFGERACIYDSLSLKQLYSLAKHQHDDWNTTCDNSTERKVLLEAINRLVQRPENARKCSPLTKTKHFIAEPWVTFDEDSLGEANDDLGDVPETELGDEILVTPEAAFKLYENSKITRDEIISAARSYISNNRGKQASTSPGPSLPDGTRPLSSPGDTLKTSHMSASAGTSILSQIEKECAKVSIPLAIREHREFSFLIES